MTSILIVDDDDAIIDTLQYLLLNEGYDVIPAKNGLDAISIYKEVKPDIVFMDIKMPMMNGFDVFFKIKESDENAQIVFTSGYAIDNEEYQHAIKSGLVGMLSKPFTIEKIIKIIDNAQN